MRAFERAMGGTPRKRVGSDRMVANWDKSLAFPTGMYCGDCGRWQGNCDHNESDCICCWCGRIERGS